VSSDTCRLQTVLRHKNVASKRTSSHCFIAYTFGTIIYGLNCNLGSVIRELIM